MYCVGGKWKIVNILGTGAFGNVTRWQNEEDGTNVAVKTCKINPKELNKEENEKVKSRWKQELEFTNKIDHDNIVRSCSNLCEDLVKEINKIAESDLPAIIMEYCDAGSLRDKLQKIENRNGFCEYDVREVLRALKNGIYYLHTRHKITHRDIKPENIVLKTGSDGRIIYKLTDVGYARNIGTNTIAGSAVGTQNYFAPEIVFNALYKNSVDYWSIAVVAFEIICGIHPFLHGELFFNVMKAINEKPEGCIAITRNLDNTLKCHMTLFPENRLSSTFSELIVPWLKLALNKDGRKRGYDELNVMRFFTALDEILDTKIVIVFSINNCKYLSYNIAETMTMGSLCARIEKDTSLTRPHLFFPAGHTYSRMTPNMKPIQLYEEEFAIKDQPMMYLLATDGNDLWQPDGSIIPTIIPQILACSKDALNNVNLVHCMLNVLFIFQNEQRRCHHIGKGLHECAMSLEDDILHIKPLVDDYSSKILKYNGQAYQFGAMVTYLKKLFEQNQNSSNASLINEFEKDVLYYKNLFAEDLDIRERYDSILCDIRALLEQLQISPIVELFGEIAQKVEKFQAENDFARRPDRKHLDSFIYMIRTAITDLLTTRMKFLDSVKEWLNNNSTSNSLKKIMMEYMRICSVLQTKQKQLNDAQVKVTELTEACLHQTLQTSQKGRHESFEYESLIEKMDTIDLSDISSVSTDDLIRESERHFSGWREDFRMEDS